MRLLEINGDDYIGNSIFKSESEENEIKPKKL
jgi:hypothetical protein